MGIEKTDELKLKKIILAYLIASPFISGYLFFIKFEVAGVVIDLFRIGLAICFLIGVRYFFSEKGDWYKFYGKGRLALGIWFIIILAVGTAHIVFQGTMPGGVSELVTVAENLIFLICMILFIQNDGDLWRFSVNILKYTGVIVALISYFELIFGFELPSSRFNEVEYYNGLSFHPATSIFANENNLAAFLLVVSAILVWQMLHESYKKRYCIKCIQLIIVIITAVIADSTIFKLGIIIITVMACLILLIKNPVSKKNMGRCGIQVLIPVLICYILKKFVRAAFIITSLNVLKQRALLSDVDLTKFLSGDSLVEQLQNTGMGTVTMRKNLFFYGVDAGRLHPFWGNGSNSFQYIFEHNAYYLEKTGGIVNPHNFLIEIFVQYGAIAVTLFLIICVVAFFVSAKDAVYIKHQSDEAYNMGFIVLMLVAFSITTVMPSSFFKSTVYFIPLFLVLIGIDLRKRKI